jgi:adhesin transport system outer membrane protein
LFESALATNPTLLALRFQAQAAGQDISTIQRQRWPNLSVTAESNTGVYSIQSLPTRAVQLDQTLWDAGQLSSRINEARIQSTTTQTSIYLKQQEIFLQLIDSWQNLMGAYGRYQVAQKNLALMNQYLAQMQRRIDAQVSPTIDLELAQARISQGEVELATAHNLLNTSITRLEQLSGWEHLHQQLSQLPEMPTLAQAQGLIRRLQDLDWSLAASEHPAVQKARLDKDLAQQQLATRQAGLWPQVYVRYMKPFPPSEYTALSRAPTIFAGVRFNPGAGFATQADAQAMATRLEGQEQLITAAWRELEQTLRNDQEELTHAQTRVIALEKAVQGAQRVLESYTRQFQASRRSWLDVMNAARELVQNQYSLVDAKVALIGPLYRLQLRLGWNNFE